MTSVEFDQATSNWARFLETHVARRASVPLNVARGMVARRIGVPAGTLENLRRGRIKGVRVWIAERIRTAVIRELEAEIARLQHDLDMARACGSRLDSDEMLSAASALAQAREVMEAAR